MYLVHAVAVLVLDNLPAGVKAFCFKKLAVMGPELTAEVEVDGMAVSDKLVLLVERKPLVNMANIKALLGKHKLYE
jgi:hypothetical protein